MPPVPVNVIMSLLSKTKEILSLVTTHQTTGCSIFIWSLIDVLQEYNDGLGSPSAQRMMLCRRDAGFQHLLLIKLRVTRNSFFSTIALFLLLRLNRSRFFKFTSEGSFSVIPVTFPEFKAFPSQIQIRGGMPQADTDLIPSCGPLIIPVDAVCVRTIPSPARLCVFSVLVFLKF